MEEWFLYCTDYYTSEHDLDDGEKCTEMGRCPRRMVKLTDLQLLSTSLMINRE